ncbi:CDGSH iron-sulfur domain-containing protein [Microbacter margulisiae]|uniref:CDGSH-type Zn-finger protein n=1 Tax=Microbacter margulisiae TaxID=1350067 RepID=A0A7W5DQ12_9PORP|nr:CDGSH iron-sulfur domain-containing protein [Microbacter margulisiae]MBB3186193.1 CDGSH-type Zn-finger protein [Microbacter margulisiae]
MAESKISAKILPNGPILISGELHIIHKDGREETKSNVAFCRCGHSNNKPFCDGTHAKIGFKDE